MTEPTIQLAFKRWPEQGVLATQDDMINAFVELRALGYRGELRVWDIQNIGESYYLEMNKDGSPSVQATMGMHALYRIGQGPVEALTPDQASERGYGG